MKREKCACGKIATGYKDFDSKIPACDTHRLFHKISNKEKRAVKETKNLMDEILKLAGAKQ